MIKNKIRAIVTTAVAFVVMFSAVNVKAAEKNSEAIKGTPVIDGTIEADWEKANAIVPEIWKAGDSGVSGIFKTMWDENYIYVLAEIKDDKLSAVEGAKDHEQDSVEIFIDEDNKKTAKYEEDDVQYRINFQNKITGGGSLKVDKVKSAVKEVSGGYVVEVALPLQTIKGKKGTTIGFDVQINNDDGSGKQVGAVGWSDTGNDAWKSTAVFGDLKLVDEGGMNLYLIAGIAAGVIIAAIAAFVLMSKRKKA